MTYRLSARAEADFTDIWVYSAEQWGTDQADRYVDALLHRFCWLLVNRALWKVRPDIAEGIRCYPEQSHVIYFRTFDSSNGGLEILRVLHGRMDPSSHLWRMPLPTTHEKRSISRQDAKTPREEKPAKFQKNRQLSNPAMGCKTTARRETMSTSKRKQASLAV